MNLRGMGLIDVVVGTSIMLVVFLSIFGAYRVAIDLVLNTKARVGGMSLVTQELEYVRGLPYEDLGTMGGIPSGTILQVSTTTLNGVLYTKDILITYVDDAADGTGAADVNGIVADYKEIKVTLSWRIHERPYSTFALTRVAPHGIESLTSGGTLRVNVFDALAQPVQGAQVRITNSLTSPAIDVTVSTDSTGSVAFPGAPPASNYKIAVTKDGYSSAQTYDVTVQNPNPNPGAVSVANQQTTTASFAIDRTGSLDVRTYSPVDVGAAQGSVTVETEATTTSVAPAQLVSWDSVAWSTAVAPEGTLLVQLVYPNGPDWSPVPDGVLSGNSGGLPSGNNVLSAVPTSTYPTLALRALFTPTDELSLPPTIDWQIDYHAGPSPLANVGFTAYGTKTIGTSISGAPIYKVVQNQTTSGAGSWLITPLEWDTYTVQLTGTSYDVAEECPTPVVVAPAAAQVVTLTLLPHTAHTLRVVVTAGGVPVSGATVSLTGPGNEVRTTSPCGQVFFSGLTTDTYTLSVAQSGYSTNVQDASVAGAVIVSVPLTP